MKILVALLIVILFLTQQAAGSSAVINIYLDEAGDALFIGTTDNPEIPLPPEIKVENGEIRGVTSVLTNKEEEVWGFSFALEGGEFFIFLPAGTTLTSINSGAEIYLSENQLVVYANNDANINYITGPSPSKTNMVWLVFLIAVILLLAVIYIYYMHSKNKKKEKQENSKENKIKLIEQMLNDREKIILNKLRETGKVKSSYLRKMCGIPKASFSRHVQELEKKNIIKRSGEGRNKFVELVEKEL